MAASQAAREGYCGIGSFAGAGFGFGTFFGALPSILPMNLGTSVMIFGTTFGSTLPRSPIRLLTEASS